MIRGAIAGLVLLSLAVSHQRFHTPPDKWEKPRRFHTEFNPQYASRIQLRHDPETPPEGERAYSANNAYWFAVAHPDTTQPGPWNARVSLGIERGYRLCLEFTDCRSIRRCEWVNEKLLYAEAWWGRALGTALLLDVEKESFVYREMVHDGVIAFQQAHAAASGT